MFEIGTEEDANNFFNKLFELTETSIIYNSFKTNSIVKIAKDESIIIV